MAFWPSKSTLISIDPETCIAYPKRRICIGKFPECCTLCTRVAGMLAIPNSVHLHCASDNKDNKSETNGFMLSLGHIVIADPALCCPHNVALGRVAWTWHYDTPHHCRPVDITACLRSCSKYCGCIPILTLTEQTSSPSETSATK
jgi:hypothetical protein